MRRLIILGILFGLLILITFPVRAEFCVDKILVKLDSTEGEEIEKDLYSYSNWKLKHLKLDFINKFSWPEHNENYFGFNVKIFFEEYKQLKLDLDYDWNERYRILSPEIKYQLELGSYLTIGLEYGNSTRTPVLDKDQKYEYLMNYGSVGMDFTKNNWSYDLKLAQARKDCPLNERESYTKNALEQKLSWKVYPNLKLALSYYETTRYHPYDIKISEDCWSSKTGIGGEYHFNDRWQVTGTFTTKEEEQGLVPYLNQQYREVKLKNKLNRDTTLNLRISSKQLDYYSQITSFGPDGAMPEEEDEKSRVELKGALECQTKLKKWQLTAETGLFMENRDYRSVQVEDINREGLYALLRWNPGKIRLELEMAPDGNLWRVNGFYQLRLEYCF